MSQINDKDSPLDAFRGARRKVVRLSQEELVKTGYLDHGHQLPLVIQPNTDSLDLPTWAEDNRNYLETRLSTHGGILFRGFRIKSIAEFERFVGSVSGEVLAYNERSSPRSQISGQIYTSTDYPPDKRIFLHNEQSYNLVFPLKICFYCAQAPETEGATPIADTRRVFARIAPEIRERFMNRKYMYVRNFGDGFGLSWEEAFQTSQKSQVQDYCRANRIDCEWKKENRLRTRQVREVAARHPKTGEWVWFNHLTFFHVNTLDPAILAEVLRAFDEEDLPNNTYYGDGGRIEDEVMDQLRAAYESEKVRFDWAEGDILMLDNMLAAHGREAYTGARRVAVGMAEAWGWDRR
ncbi:MAG TPA: TauD/TfdA family dioxygenase [Blastocatellia bacterium]|nr:TauD/TfdA family dioxygenase [Blastocatellia bacterium]